MNIHVETLWQEVAVITCVHKCSLSGALLEQNRYKTDQKIKNLLRYTLNQIDKTLDTALNVIKMPSKDPRDPQNIKKIKSCHHTIDFSTCVQFYVFKHTISTVNLREKFLHGSGFKLELF